MTRKNALENPKSLTPSRTTFLAALVAASALLLSACGGTEADAAAPADLATASAASRAEPSSLGAPGISFAAGPDGALTATVTLSFDARRTTPVYVSMPRAVLAGPTLVWVAEGSNRATFTVSPNPYLAADSLATVSARTQNPDPNTVAMTTISVAAGAAAGQAKPEVQGLRFSPDTISSGGSTVATLTLTAPAPAGGAVVGVSNANDYFGAVAQVPSTVVVPEGATSVQFTVAAGSTTFPNALPIAASYFGGPFTGSYLTVVP